MIKNKNADFLVSTTSHDIPIFAVHGNSPNAARMGNCLHYLALPLPNFHCIVVTSRHVNQPELAEQKRLD